MIEPIHHYQKPEIHERSSEINQQLNIWKKIKTKIQGLVSWLWILVVAVYLTIGASRSVISNYKLNQEIEFLKKNVTELELEKQRLEALAVYYETDAYKEKELRKRLLLKRPGEYVIAMPAQKIRLGQGYGGQTEDEGSAYAKSEDSASADKRLKPKRANWEKWLDFFKGELGD